MNIILIGFGGALGAVLRHIVNELISKYLPYFKSISTSMQVQKALEIVTLDESNDTISNINKRIID